MASWPPSRIVFAILGGLSLLASMALIYGSIGLGFLTAFSDDPSATGADWRVWALGGIACLILSAALFRPVWRASR